MNTTAPAQHLEELAINAVIFFVFGCFSFLVIIAILFFGNLDKQGCFYTFCRFIKLKFMTFCCCCCGKKTQNKITDDMEEFKELVSDSSSSASFDVV